jgi:hypothetical protein
MLVDANLLLYARNADDPRHDAARDWLEAALNGDRRVGLPWQSLHAFLRIATSPRVFPEPLSGSEAMHQIEDWLDAPSCWVPEPTLRHRAVLARLLADRDVVGSLVTDASLAALAIEHDVPLYSTDTDFARFAGLTWVDPLRMGPPGTSSP